MAPVNNFAFFATPQFVSSARWYGPGSRSVPQAETLHQMRLEYIPVLQQKSEGTAMLSMISLWVRRGFPTSTIFSGGIILTIFTITKAPIDSTEDGLETIDIDAVTGINSHYARSNPMRRAKDALTSNGWKVATLAATGVNGLLLLIVLVMQFTAATKPTTSSIPVEYMARSDRSPASIADFARSQMIGIFTWRNPLPVEGNLPDPDIAVGQGKISTASYHYTFGLSPAFAELFRVKLAAVMSKLTSNGAREVVYIPNKISKPTLVSPGVWTVDVFGSLFYGKDLKVGASIPINRRLTIRAVPPLTLSEASASYKDRELAVAVARIRSQGLETTSMMPLPRNSTVPNSASTKTP